MEFASKQHNQPQTIFTAPLNFNIDFPIGENNITTRTYFEKMKAYNNSYNYMLDIALSLLKYKGFDNTNIDDEDFNNHLIIDGSIAIAKSNIGIIACPYSVEKRNYKGKPTAIRLTPCYNDNDGIDTAKSLYEDDFIIVYLNRAHRGYLDYLQYHASIEACLSTLLNNNVIAKSLQNIIQGKAERLNDIENVMNAIYNQNGVLKLALPDTARVEDYIKLDKNDSEFIAEQIYTASTNNINAFFSRCGVNYTPYEKRERLTNEEIKTNNMALDLIRSSMIETVQKGLNEANKKFGFELSVTLSIDNKETNESVGGENNINDDI